MMLNFFMSILLMLIANIFAATEQAFEMQGENSEISSPGSSTRSVGSDHLGLVTSATTTLSSMLPFLAEESTNKIMEVINLLQSDRAQKFREAEILLRACEIIPRKTEEESDSEDSPTGLEVECEQRSIHLLNQDIWHVLRSLELHLSEFSAEDSDYDGDTENNGSNSPGGFSSSDEKPVDEV